MPPVEPPAEPEELEELAQGLGSAKQDPIMLEPARTVQVGIISA